MSWEAIASFSSAIIALCALGLTLWQAYVSRQHNRLSVTPYLTTWSHNDTDQHRYSVEILNNGIGPALINNFQVFVDGHQVKGDDLELIKKSLKLLFPQYQYNAYNSYLSEGYMMAPKESRNLVMIQFFGPNFPKPEEIEHSTKRVKILIEYESIYREKFKYDSSKLQVLN
jgi:hypothetical protein